MRLLVSVQEENIPRAHSRRPLAAVGEQNGNGEVAAQGAGVVAGVAAD